MRMPENLPKLRSFLAKAAVNTLVSPRVNEALARDVREIEAELRGTYPAASAQAINTVLAGLWLRAGDLDSGHGIAQAIPTPLGSAWHAIMHRREGDFWNSKYWWRQARALPWPARLAPEVAQHFAENPHAAASALEKAAHAGTYDPSAFVDAVESAGRDAQCAVILEVVQEMEWRALFELSLAELESR